MYVLITGASGFIGSHLAERLHQKGYRLKCLVRRTSDLRWLRHLPIEYVYGDFFDKSALTAAVEGVDVIYHSAGVVASKSARGFFEGNQVATRNLLHHAERVNPKLQRFVHISSLAAVGPSVDGQPVDEETPYHPITTYGRSKMEAEKEVTGMGSSFPWTIVRPPTVYGPRDSATFNFFNTASKGLLPLVGLKKKYVSMVHVRDLVEGIILAGELPVALRQSYFIGSERPYDWDEIGSITMEVLGRRALKVRLPEPVVFAVAGIVGFVSLFKNRPSVLNWEKGRDMVQAAWTCSVEKAKRELGYREQIALKDGIRETVEWYRKEGWMK